jgi:hypothetical protein
MKARRIEIKWGIYFVIMGLVWVLLERVVGLHDEHIDKHMTYTNLIAIPAIAMYMMALIEKRRVDYGGVMTFKQGFVSGLVVTLVVTLLSPISQLITSLLISPNFFENAKGAAVAQGYMTAEAAEVYFKLENYIVQGIMFAPLMGIVTSLIVAAAARKRSLQV